VDTYEYSELLKSLTNKMENITNIVKPDDLQGRLDEIEQMQQDPDFWNDAAKAAKISQEKTRTERILETYNNANDALADAKEYFELAKSEKDEETLEMLFEDAESLEEHIKALEVQMMLSGEHDSNNAIVSIHPGAGGTESQDWASMLYRMYLRWVAPPFSAASCSRRPLVRSGTAPSITATRTVGEHNEVSAAHSSSRGSRQSTSRRRRTSTPSHRSPGGQGKP